MKLPKKWLCEYVDFNVSNEEFVEKMMWRGFELAGIEKELPGVEGVVVGRVLSIAKHENSDHLHICQVDVGKETLTSSPERATLWKARWFRGCSRLQTRRPRDAGRQYARCDELRHALLGQRTGAYGSGLSGAGEHGILLLKEEHPLGQSIKPAPGQNIDAALGFDDVIFEFDLTPNRPDCISILGMCREAAAALGQAFREPKIAPVKGAGNAADYARVTVENYDLCPRYTARVIKDIKIEPSPLWMQKKLRSVGMRPINNIVDITNYVLVEYGHPMHAFDLACISGSHIVVRTAHQGEVVTTLDNMSVRSRRKCS
jgi:phenylalanyl-tRNA synthetase beta chain